MNNLLENCKQYKRNQNVMAVVLDENVEIITEYGLLKGRAGDYLVVEPEGFLYIYNKTIFESMHTISWE